MDNKFNPKSENELKKALKKLKPSKHSVGKTSATLQITNAKVSVGTSINDAYPALPPDGWGYVDKSGSPVIINPTVDDINQGQISDCYFLVCLMTIVDSYPSYINYLLRPEVDANNVVIPGKWMVFFTNGTIITRVHIDCEIDNIQNRTGTDGDYWVAMIEKAYAFYRYQADTFSSLNEGSMYNVFMDFGLGSNNYIFWLGQNQSILSIMNMLKQGLLVTFGTVTSPISPLVGSHAYGALKYSDQPDKDLTIPTKILIRNPWGNQGGVLITEFNQQIISSFSFMSTGQIPSNYIVIPPKPTIQLTVDKTSIYLGETIILNWQGTNYTNIMLDGVPSAPLNGPIAVSPTTNPNTFTITASGLGGTATSSIRVNVYEPGDLNKDGIVNFNDMLVVTGNWNQTGPNPGDANKDGIVNSNDMLVVTGHWNQTVPSGT